MSTISKHHQVWWKSIEIYLSYCPETDRWTDGQIDGHMDNQSDIMIPRHYRVAEYKKGVLSGDMGKKNTYFFFFCLICVEVLRPSQLNRVMSSMVSLLNHTFSGQA